MPSVMPPSWVIAIVVVAGAALLVAVFRPAWCARIEGWFRQPDPLPYYSCEYLCNKGATAFYHALRRAVGRRFGISMKVRLADVITCLADSWHAGYGMKIAAKHLDFVLHDPHTTKIVAVIELDGSSHRWRSRRQRDAFVDWALETAGVPIIRFQAASSYDAGEIAGEIDDVLAAGASEPKPYGETG